MKISHSLSQPDVFGVEPGVIKPAVTEIARFDYSQISTGHYNILHLHHFHQLDVILDGEFTLTLKGQEDQIGHPGDAWIIPPLIWHGVDCRKPFRWCSFKFHLAPHLWPVFGTTFQRFPVSELVSACVEAMGKRNRVIKPLAGEQAAAAIALCLVEFMDQHIQIAAQDDYLVGFRHVLWPMLEKIQQEPSIKWSVARMAAELGLSPDYFTRCFRDITRQTPQQYIMQTAMRGAAADLLKVQAPPIKEIAERAGYANVQAFTHAFTRVFKISPAAYKRQAIQENSVENEAASTTQYVRNF